jgi:uncharacterized protein YjeT (DUF2065 family)
MFAIEGILLALFPNVARKAMSILVASPDSYLRYSGVASAVVGVLIVFLVRSLG